ncbi:MAG: hypothetical protein O4965_03210 [Trichodesmium sp. St19_bin1]|jgi:hypothetical protein|nr:hypothetical protein [Trichodesmium sp. St19_bin1]
MTTTYTFYYNTETGEKFPDLDPRYPNINYVLCIEGDMLTQQKIEEYVKANPKLENHIRNDLGEALRIEQSKKK